jgi:YD repeat-containing protein
VDVPGAGADTTTVYTPDGLVQRIETTLPASRFERKYEYNRRRLVTAELQDHWQLWSGTWFRVPMDHRWYYDALGHVTWSKSPNNTWIDYAPNALGQPTRAGVFASNALYGPDGQLASFTFGNGIERTVTRNTRGLPQRITDQRFGQAVFDEQYGWDANGNLQFQDDALNLPGGDRELHYDGRDRLTSSWISGYGNESFGWDAFDRLRTRSSSAGTDTYTYDGAHRLTSINGPSGVRSYAHDARGNVTGRPGYTHVFDAVNRLVQSQPLGGNVESYEYDGHGRRTAILRSNGSIKVDYDTRDGVLRASADTGMRSTGGSAVYVHLGEVLVAQDAWAWRSPFGMT